MGCKRILKTATALTVVNFVWLSPLLINKNDCDQDNDLGHNAQERPEGSQTATYTQVDGDRMPAQNVIPIALVISGIGDLQAIDGQSGIVRCALDDEILSAIGNRLSERERAY